MAKEPNKASGLRISNIMGYLRGNIDLDKSPAETKTLAFGSKEIISNKRRSEILSDAYRATDDRQARHVSESSILSLVQGSMGAVGRTRMENRKILELNPMVEKAGRLMIATTMAPNDLSRDEVQIVFDAEDEIPESYRTRLNDFATHFFDRRLNLRKSMPEWLFQAGYESGASVFSIIPLRSFETIEDAAFLGTESLVAQVVQPIATESLFGFGDAVVRAGQLTKEVAGLESFGHAVMTEERDRQKIRTPSPTSTAEIGKVIEQMIGAESLSLTDNPNILQIRDITSKRLTKRTTEVINKRFGRVAESMITSVNPNKTPDKDGGSGVVGEPIFMRLPPESVTVIHTPGDPSDHQGYLVLLDRLGNPIDAVIENENLERDPSRYNNAQNDIFSQVHSAYGFGSTMHNQSRNDMMGRVYNQVVTEHLRKRIDQAGFGNAEIANSEGVMRCMFARFLQKKMTRVLFLPKALVTYLAFELDQNGYGVSRLERIKFSLGMKMAVRVSRVLAAIKAAMDNRKIEIKFTEDMMVNPESVINTVVQEYLRKSTIQFSTDPSVIQSQIADKSMSIRALDVPGCESFDLINEPDARTGSFDFDSNINEELDNEINNGLRVPAAALNSLGEDEYSRSVATSNLFFSMDVSIDQDTAIHHVSDFIQKYATYSEEFREGIFEILPALKNNATKSDAQSSIDSAREHPTSSGIQAADADDVVLPEGFSLDDLIASMYITLPRPNVAPSKAQFEALDGMITAITNAVTALFPDDLAGPDDTLAPVVRTLRARFIANNIRSYLESSGMSNIAVPETNFSDDLADMGRLVNGLENVKKMIEDRIKQTAPKEETGVDGY